MPERVRRFQKSPSNTKTGKVATRVENSNFLLQDLGDLCPLLSISV